MGLLVSLHHISLTHGLSNSCIDCQIASFRWNVHVSASLPPSSVHGLFPIIWTASVCFRGMESPLVCWHLLVGFFGISIGLDCAHPLLVVALHPPLSRCAPLSPTTKEVHTVPYWCHCGALSWDLSRFVEASFGGPSGPFLGGTAKEVDRRGMQRD